jgi:hypothetical protein
MAPDYTPQEQHLAENLLGDENDEGNPYLYYNNIVVIFMLLRLLLLLLLLLLKFLLLLYTQGNLSYISI